MPKIGRVIVELDRPNGPFGMGNGFSTLDHFKCSFCGREYNESPESEEYARHFDFGPLVIGECRFGALEDAVEPMLYQIVAWKVAKAERRDEAASAASDAAKGAVKALEALDG